MNMGGVFNYHYMADIEFTEDHDEGYLPGLSAETRPAIKGIYQPGRVNFQSLTQTEKAIFQRPFGKFGDPAISLWGRQVVDRLTEQGQREALHVLRISKEGRESSVRDGRALDSHVSTDAVDRLIDYIEYRVLLATW